MASNKRPPPNPFATQSIRQSGNPYAGSVTALKGAPPPPPPPDYEDDINGGSGGGGGSSKSIDAQVINTYDPRTTGGAGGFDASDSDDDSNPKGGINAQFDSLYDPRTMGGAPSDDEEEEPPLPTIPNRDLKPNPASTVMSNTVAAFATMKRPSASSIDASAAAGPRAVPSAGPASAAAAPAPAAAASVGSAGPAARKSSSGAMSSGSVVDEHITRMMENGSEWWNDDARKFGLAKEPWFHGVLGREGAEAKLQTCPLGYFLMRVSAECSYVLSIRFRPDKIMHVKVKKNPDAYYVGQRRFTRPQDVVTHYRENYYAEESKLVAPCCRDGSMPAAVATTDTPLAPKAKANMAHMNGTATLPARRHTAAAAPAGVHTRASVQQMFAPPPPAAEPVIQFELHNYETADEALKTQYELMREKLLAQGESKAKLDDDPRKWDSAEVLRFIKEKDMSDFKDVFYSNGIDGKKLIALNASEFKRGGFSLERCELLGSVIRELRDQVDKITQSRRREVI